MGALIGLLATIAPPLIRGIESLFSGKAKSGEDKMDALVQSVRAVIQKMLAAKVPGVEDLKQPTDDALRGALEMVFQQMSDGGKLKPAGDGELYLVRMIGAPTKVQ